MAFFNACSEGEKPLVSDLVLYHYPVTRSARVLWLLHELGPDTVPFTLQRVELFEGEHK